MSKEDSTSEQKCVKCGHPKIGNRQPCVNVSTRLCDCECSFPEAAAEDQNSNDKAKNSSSPRTESPHSAQQGYSCCEHGDGMEDHGPFCCIHGAN